MRLLRGALVGLSLGACQAVTLDPPVETELFLSDTINDQGVEGLTHAIFNIQPVDFAGAPGVPVMQLIVTDDTDLCSKLESGERRIFDNHDGVEARVVFIPRGEFLEGETYVNQDPVEEIPGAVEIISTNLIGGNGKSLTFIARSDTLVVGDDTLTLKTFEDGVLVEGQFSAVLPRIDNFTNIEPPLGAFLSGTFRAEHCASLLF
jgi:hypothetical protein